MGELINTKIKTDFKKDYYQDTILNKNGEYVTTGKLKPMYHLHMTKPYFCDNKVKVLKMAISDLEEELKRLKEIDKQNDERMERWDSISK